MNLTGGFKQVNNANSRSIIEGVDKTLADKAFINMLFAGSIIRVYYLHDKKVFYCVIASLESARAIFEANEAAQFLYDVSEGYLIDLNVTHPYKQWSKKRMQRMNRLLGDHDVTKDLLHKFLMLLVQ